MRDDIIETFHANGTRTVRPKPRCKCGGIQDPHPTHDLRVCRACGEIVQETR